MQEIRFDQKKTMVGQLVEFVTHMFQNQNNSVDNAKLLVVLSDGRNIFSETPEKVRSAIRRARLADIFLVFIIVDNPLNKVYLLFYYFTETVVAWLIICTLFRILYWT